MASYLKMNFTINHQLFPPHIIVAIDNFRHYNLCLSIAIEEGHDIITITITIIVVGGTILINNAINLFDCF